MVEQPTTVVVALLGREPILCASFASDCWPGFSKRRFGSVIVLRVHPLGCGKNALSGFKCVTGVGTGVGVSCGIVVKLLGGMVQLVVGPCRLSGTSATEEVRVRKNLCQAAWQGLRCVVNVKLLGV